MRTAPVMALAAVVTAATLGIQTVRADPGPATPAAAQVMPSAASLAAESLLRTLTDAPVALTRDARGLAHLVGASAGHTIPLPAGILPTADAETQARAHLARTAALFGLTDQASELRADPVDSALGNLLGTDRVLRFQQLRRGVPVLGGELIVVLDALGDLKSITGETSPDRSTRRASVTADQARGIALAAVTRNHPDAYAPAIRSSRPELWQLDPVLLGFPATTRMSAGPVWRSEVTDAGAVRDLVLVDARTGVIALQLDLIQDANRVVCDRDNKADRSPLGADCTPTYARAEGEGPASAPVDVDQAFDNTGAASTFYQGYLGVDLSALLGVDTGSGDGKRLRSTVRFCPGTNPCEATQGTLFDNAFWNGRGMYYGTGWPSADDVVAHELTHGVTEKTARLLYLYQSGAISESMSDVFGELVDLTDNVDGPGTQAAWVVGEDAPLDQLPIRNMADPRTTLLPIGGQPDRMTAPNYAADLFFADNGGVHDNNGVGNKAAYLIAVGTGAEPFNGQSITGIGLRPTAVLYYRALRMLTSGADYADLGGVLTQACANLVGAAGFTSATCAQVAKAVAATEMAKQPRGTAGAAEANVCPSGTTKVSLLTDGFERFSKKTWSLGAQWSVSKDYAKSGAFSLYGLEPNRALSSPATLKTPLTVPRGVKTYLRFAHQYRLDAGLLENGVVDRYYDGAVLEYRLGSGSWKSASDRTWENGPTRRISPDPGAGYKAFGGDSHGFGSARLDLKFLAGQRAQFRWRLIGDREFALDGWTIDDVSFYACGGATPSEARSVKVSGKGSTRTLAWSPPVYAPAAGLTGYQLLRKGGRAAKQVTSVGASKRSVTFTGLKKGRKYTFEVIPRAQAGTGPAAATTTTIR